GDRPDGRGRVEAADGNRLDARGARRSRSAHHAARDRARSAAQGDRQGIGRAPDETRERAGGPQGRTDATAVALAAGKGRNTAKQRDQEAALRSAAAETGRGAERLLRQSLGTAVRPDPRARTPDP